MAIKIYGDPESPEYGAAEQLRDLIATAWGEDLMGVDLPGVDPGSGGSEEYQNVTIKTGAKLHQQNKRDIDIMLLVSLETELEVKIPRADEAGQPSIVWVKNMLVVIEVKDHPPELVEFTGAGELWVQYDDGKKAATEQSEGQLYGLLKYLPQSGVCRETQPGEPLGTSIPFMANVIWLRNVPTAELPAPPHNIVGADATFGHFLSAIMTKKRSEQRSKKTRVVENQRIATVLHGTKGFDVIESTPTPGLITQIAVHFTKLLKPSLLDQKKIAAICQETAFNLIEDINSGEQQVVFRGRGGTGKTIGLLMYAYKQYVSEKARSIILTYNVALAAELARLLVILKVRDSAEGSSIRINTLQSFLGRVLFHAELFDEEDSYIEILKDPVAYSEKKAELLKILKDEERLDSIRHESEAGQYDIACIDEAQDCPEDERDIIHRVFGAENCIVADGIDQLVRKSHCDWRFASAAPDTQTISLHKSLRMQSNLCSFANVFAARMNLGEWRVEENRELLGGRVIISQAHSFLDLAHYEELAELNKNAGNSPVDMLFCVPSSLSGNSAEGHCKPAQDFLDRGLKVWDGTRPDVREIPVLDNEEHRFVHYESCRGLEGWITVLYRFDELFEEKVRFFRRQEAEDGSLSRARHRAAEWLMIPLTRCINTLVIHVGNPDSEIAAVLRELAVKYEDFVEMRDGEASQG